MTETSVWDAALLLAAAAGIVEIEFSLSGGGDDGETTLEAVRYADGAVEHTLPDIPVSVLDHGGILTVETVLSSLAADLPEGDWVNNEGGHGTVIIRPQTDDENLRFEVDMTYGDEDDDEDFDDDPDFDDEDPTDDADLSLGRPTVVFPEDAQ